MWYLFIVIPLSVIAVLCLLFVFLIAPRRRRSLAAMFSHHVYAHRGLHGNGVPENSRAAFRLAVEQGYGIELDVQLSKDGIPVVFHDGTLRRMCGEGIKGGPVDYTAEELSRMTLAGTGETIPTFREVLDLVGGRVPLVVEIKNDGNCLATCRAAAEELRRYAGMWCVESFNPLAVHFFRKERPDAVRGVLSERFMKEKELRKPLYFALQILVLNFLARPDFIAYDFRDAGRSLAFRLCRLLGAYTFAFTVRTEEDEALAEKNGFDTVIFENITPKRKSL